MSTLWRYIRLFGYFVSFSFGKAFEFRFDFYMRIIMDLAYYAVAIAFFKVLYLHTGSLGGWSEEQAMVFVASFCIVDAINMTLFANNLWMLPTYINRGDLDYYLVRPVSSLFFVSLRDFAANSFINLVLALLILVWSLSIQTVAVPLYKIPVYLLLLLNGAFLFYCLNFMANTLVFWTHSPQGFGDIVWTMMKMSERPDRIYRGWVRKLLTTVLPFAVISSYPTRFLLEGFDPWILLTTLGVSAGFFVTLLALWRFALRNYSSASS